MTDLIEKRAGDLLWLAAEDIAAPHAFTARYGGVSTESLASLNLGEHRGDAEENVRKNYEIVCAALGFDPENLVFSRQVHGRTVRVVTGADRHALFAPVPFEADGLVTTKPGLTLVIFTADCVPILLYDPVRGAVGACHAGWRGTSLDIAGETVRAMCAAFGCRPENIRAAVGPAIGACCFETDGDVPAAMRARLGPAAEPFIHALPADRYRVDLKALNAALLRRAGAAVSAVSADCTMCRHDRFWSHRYTRGDRGSQAAFIMLPQNG